MQDLYKGFKKTSEDESGATLEHENGHSLTIAKSGLSKKQKLALSKLPLHQAKGTQLENPVTTSEDQAKTVGANIADAVANKILEGATEAASPIQQPQLSPQQIEAMPVPNATSVDTGQPVYKMAPEFVEGEGLSPEEVLQIRGGGAEVRDPYRLATEATLQQAPLAFTPSLPQQMGQPLADVAEEPERMPAKEFVAPAAPVVPQPLVPQPALSDDERFSQTILDPNIAPSQKQQAFLERRMRKLAERERIDQEFYDRMRAKEIEPSDLLRDRSTLAKIGTVIAMAFSGIGAGITGKENMVMQVLNDQINREIEAQKRAEERDFNLYKFHSQQLENSVAADAQLANDMINIAKLQTDEMIHGYGANNPIIRQRAALFKTELEAKQAELRAKIAEAKTADDVKRLLQMQTTAPGKISKMSPARLLELKKGDASVKAEATKEIAQREQLVRNAPLAMEALDRTLEELGSKKGAIKGAGTLAYSLVDAPQSLKDFRNAIRSMVPDVVGGGSKETIVQAILQDIEPKPFEVYKGEASQIRQRVLNWLQRRASTPNLDRLEIDPDAFESTALRPETWGVQEQNVTVQDIKTGEKLKGTQAQADEAIKSGRYRLVK